MDTVLLFSLIGSQRYGRPLKVIHVIHWLSIQLCLQNTPNKSYLRETEKEEVRADSRLSTTTTTIPLSSDMLRKVYLSILLWPNNHNNNNNIINGSITTTSHVSLASLLIRVLSIMSIIIIILFLLALFYCWWIRHRTYRKLVQSGLPTVFWRPKFVQYQPPTQLPPPPTTTTTTTIIHTTATADVDHDQDDSHSNSTCTCTPTPTRVHVIKDRKLPSSSITNILPRMQRLQGPYRMYGTVYGIDTAVVHMAHPIPAMHVLNHYQQQQQQQQHQLLVATPSDRKTRNKPQQQQQQPQQKLWESTGVLKMPAYNHFFDFCGQGVFTADGKDWKQKRAAVLHALLMRNNNNTNNNNNNNNKKMSNWEEHLIGLAQNKAIELVQALAVHAQLHPNQQQQQQREKSRDIVPLLQRTTIGLIYEYITHTPLKDAVVQDNINNNKKEEDEQSESSPALSNCAPTTTTSTTKETVSSSTTTATTTTTTTTLLSFYLESIIRIRLIILAQARSMWFLLPRWMYRMFSSLSRDEECTMGPIRQFARLAIQKALPGSPIAHLQSLQLYQPNRDEVSSISNNLLYETITLLFAGQDTSAATLSWTLHLLSLHPDKQAKLAEEVCRVMKQQTCDDDDDTDDVESNESKVVHNITKKDIARMLYLDAVLKESMRLYPVAPFVVRKITHPVTLPPETKNATPTVLPEGALACIWIYGLHRNPEFWHRPDDFLPERWLNNNDETIEIDKGLETSGAYMPFAQGPRNCLGQPLAHIVLRCLLAYLIHSYEFEDVDGGVRKDMQAGFTVLPQGGVPLVWTSRQNAERA